MEEDESEQEKNSTSNLTTGLPEVLPEANLKFTRNVSRSWTKSFTRSPSPGRGQGERDPAEELREHPATRVSRLYGGAAGKSLRRKSTKVLES